MQLATPASRSFSFASYARGVGLERGLARWIDLGELGGDLTHRLLRVPRVVPPVGVVLGGLRSARLARQLHRDAGTEVDDPRVAAAVVDDLVHPGIEVVAVGEDDLGVGRRRDVVGSRLIVVGVGVGGEDLVHVHLVAPDLAGEVADLGGRRHHRDLARIRAGAPAAGGEEGHGDAGGRGQPQSARTNRSNTGGDSEHRPAERRNRRPGRRVGLHGQPQTHGALRGSQEHGSDLPGRHPIREQPNRRGGCHEQGGHQQGSDHAERCGGRKGDQAEQDDLEPALAGGWAADLVEPGRQPPPAEEDVADEDRHRGHDREPDIGAVDQQQAAEEQLFDVRAGVVDVARQDHAACEAADEDERREAVVCGPTPAGQPPHGGGEGDCHSERPERR